MRVTPEQQASRVAMAEARVAVSDIWLNSDLSVSEFLMVLAEVQVSTLGRVVRDEHSEEDQ